MRWCLGLPEREVRRLTTIEVERVRSARARAAWRGVGLALLALAAGPAFALGASAAGFAGLAAFVGVIGTFLLGVPVAILVGRDAGSLVVALGRDLREGRGVVFAEGVHEVVVLPRSRIAVVRDGATCQDLRRLPIGDAAQNPLDLRPPMDGPAAADGWRERALADEERREVLRRMALYGRRRSGLLRFWSGARVTFAIAVLVLWFASASTRGGREASVVAAILYLAAEGWRAVHGRRARAALALDAARGVVNRLESGRHAIEILPASGLIWTENGKPAGWRQDPESA